MAVKHILTYLEGLESDKPALETASRLAVHFDSEIEALHIKLDPKESIPFVGQGISAPVVEQIISSVESESTDVSKRAKKNYSDFKKNHTFGAIKWTEKEGRATEILPEYARLTDLVIMSQLSTTSEEMTKLIAEEVVRESARPVLFAPEDTPASIGKTILFYWNGSRESARILTAAFPFLRKADHITLVTSQECEDLDLGPDKVIKALARHNITPAVVKIDESGERLAESLLDQANTLKADLIIMGAYTQSKLREWVMGSMTDYILKHTNLPLLVIH